VPVTITAPISPGNVGPGFSLDATSDFIGPLTNPSFWLVEITDSSDETDVLVSWYYPATTTHIVKTIGFGSDNTFQWNPAFGAHNQGDTVRLSIQLLNNLGETVDSGSQTYPLDSITGMPYVQEILALQTPTEGTFTSTDRAAMTAGFTDIINGLTTTITTAAGEVQATLGALFSRSTLDALTLEELTSGPTGDPVRVTIDSFWYGVIVRLTTIASNLEPMTPDGDWYLPDLAVLRVRRGVDLEYRHGIHTSSWMAPSPWRYGLEVLNLLELGAVPPETEVMVDFRPGCEGQVFLMAWP